MKTSKFPTIDVLVSVSKKAYNLEGHDWIYDEKTECFELGELSLKNVTEKEDEEEWWKIYGPGLEVSGRDPEECVSILGDIYRMIGEAINDASSK